MKAWHRHLLALWLAGCVGIAGAAEKPLWEFGLGVGAVSFPDFV